MSAPAILVIAPTRRELGGLRDGRGAYRTALCGIGREAGERAAALLDAAPCDLLVSLGFAGALDPSLRPGDLIVADTTRAPALSHRSPLHNSPLPVGSRFRGNDDAPGGHRVTGRVAPRLLALSRRLVSRLPGFSPTRESRRREAPPLSYESATSFPRKREPTAILTVAAPLLTPAAKRRARAASGASAVDMEERWIADATEARGVPLISVRAILDEADFALPPFAAAIAADGGRREWARALRAAINPLEARRIIALALRARKAARSLRRSADAILVAPSERL